MQFCEIITKHENPKYSNTMCFIDKSAVFNDCQPAKATY